jgi:hypothetical protein
MSVPLLSLESLLMGQLEEDVFHIEEKKRKFIDILLHYELEDEMDERHLYRTLQVDIDCWRKGRILPKN